MATYPWNLVIGRINVAYTLPMGEIAVNTLHVAAADGPGEPTGMAQSTLEQAMVIVRNGIEDLMQDDLSFSGGAKVDHLDGYLLAPTPPHKATAKSTLAGRGYIGGSSANLPLEVSCVASLYGYDPDTFVAQRARKRGRNYVPGLAVPSIDSRGLFTDSFASLVATAWAGIGSDLWTNGGGTARVDLVVASRTGDFLTSVEAVRVDNIPDVQRRRQNALTPTYTVETVERT